MLPAFYVLFLNSIPGNISIFCITFTSHFLNTVFLLGSLKFHIFSLFSFLRWNVLSVWSRPLRQNSLPLVHIHHLYVWHVAAKQQICFHFRQSNSSLIWQHSCWLLKRQLKWWQTGEKQGRVDPTHVQIFQIIVWFVTESQTCVQINSFFTCLHRLSSVNDRGKTEFRVYIRCHTKVDFILPLSLTQDTGCR